MLQLPQATANGHAAQPSDKGQLRNAAATVLVCEGRRDQPAGSFVGEDEELVQRRVLPGDSPLRVFAALGAGTAVRRPTVALRGHDKFTP
jgi:hypothetical protein